MQDAIDNQRDRQKLQEIRELLLQRQRMEAIRQQAADEQKRMQLIAAEQDRRLREELGRKRAETEKLAEIDQREQQRQEELRRRQVNRMAVSL